MNHRLVPVSVLSPLIAVCVAVASWSAFAATTINDLDRIGRQITKEKCVRPTRVIVERVKNRYENVMDEIKTFSCPGYRVVVYEAHASGVVRELPMGVVLNGSISKVLPAFSAGMEAGRVREMLGATYSENGKELVYSLSEERPGEDTVTFRLEHGRVKSIIWGWDVD